MASTVRVVLRSSVVLGDSTVTVSTSADNWRLDQPCLWQAESQDWVADVDLGGLVGGLELKFKRDGVWQSGLNLQVTEDQLAAPQFFGDLEVVFLFPRSLVVDTPSPARRIFDPSPDRPDADIIIVGSGVGGGVLAYELAALRPERPLRILVLEAGGYLFPTHIGNLPRIEPEVGQSQQPWQLWSDYYAVPVQSNLDDLTEVPQKGPEVSRALNLGGRSLFWGCLAPRAQSWELASWDPRLRSDIPAFYAEAELRMRVKPLRTSQYESRAVQALKAAAMTREALAAFTHDPAPIAAQLQAQIPTMIPTGMFSTAELLIERKLADGGNGFPNLDVLLNQEVVSVESAGPDGDRTANGVTARDRTSGRVRNFRTAQNGAVVLSAGATSSPLIAQASALSSHLSAPLVGAGLTDHAIWVQPFTVPPASLGEQSWFEEKKAAVVLSRPNDGSSATYPFNIRLALNTRLTLARFVDPSRFRLRPEMPGEIVFLLSSDLIDTNRVHGAPSRPEVSLTEVSTPPPDVAERITHITTEMLAVFGANKDGDGFLASFGGVGHEVGTMRMDCESAPGVVDTDLLIKGTRNVYACDLSVFPTSPAANPSLTLAALALRLAKHLAQVIV